MGAVSSFFYYLVTNPVKLVNYALLGGGGIGVSISVIKAAITGSFTDYLILAVSGLSIFLGFVGIENLGNLQMLVDHTRDFFQVYWKPLGLLGLGLSGLYFQSFLDRGLTEQLLSYASIALLVAGLAYTLYLALKGPEQNMPDYFEEYRLDIDEAELMSLKQVVDDCIKQACDDKLLEMGVDLCTIDPASEDGLEAFRLKFKETRPPRADANMCRKRILEGRILCYKDKERAARAGLNCARLTPFKIPDVP
jgi:hypothetical protein